MKIIGRKREKELIKSTLESGRPEFLVVYGRRRVGKTYLIREYFNGNFAFYSTGVPDMNMKGQLRIFYESLIKYGSSAEKPPKDWFEAFELLRKLLESNEAVRDPASNRIVIFLDELPWMDTPKSGFKSALDFFWNSFASAKEDIVLIACGSATSWIINNLLNATGGLYNRVTRQLFLEPFSLKECEELFKQNGIEMTRQQVIQSYMIFGGIPYYLNCMDRRLSLPQNIDAICFRKSGQLHFEFDRLYASLFTHSERHMLIIRALAKKKMGLTRSELADQKNINNGQSLTTALNELEQCGFIRKYKNLIRNKKEWYYQVIDPFTLFYFTFMENADFDSWLKYVGTPGYYAWEGNAFELVCLLHLHEIKSVLGISSVETAEYGFRSSTSNPGAQIDLIIDRNDDVINLCEMKFSNDEFVIDSDYEKNLINKSEVFRKESNTKKAIHLTMIALNGLKHNAHSNLIINEVTGEELFLSTY